MSGISISKIYSDKELHLIQQIVDKINFLRPMAMLMSDEEIHEKRHEFKARLDKGESLDDILPEAFAVVREATDRVRHTPHYDVQLMGGIVLHQGRVAQMCTGEGKTQTCILPAYLNALEGKGVHVITCNDYLSARDAEELRPVYEFLGMSVGAIKHEMNNAERKAEYACDITYVTNADLAFDYLKDNMAIYKENQMQRGLHYCIIDEVDSVLIDSAKSPLRISGRKDADMSLYKPANEFVKTLELGEEESDRSKLDYVFQTIEEDTGDYVLDKKNNRINLTEAGVEKAEKYFKIANLADPENLAIRHHINNALRANYLLERDIDYLVNDEGKVKLIDTFTGRAMDGCKFSNGLHEAIEVKEGLRISRASMTIANITYQKFFNKYDKKGGLTGTGLTEENEFKEIYSMDVVVIPTHRPIQRIDHPDAVYKSKKEKMIAVVESVRVAYEKKQPVLVGVATVEDSEEVSQALLDANIPHELLNAKRLDQEAEIVSHAGEVGAITVATNMAGRGTDIKIAEESRAAGGLKVIGTEHFESRRVDDQLRGRSGRQGDVGESQFIISLEDDILVKFGSEKMIEMFESMDFPEGHAIEHKSLTKTVETAQKKIEENNFAARKNVFQYDEVVNEQRELMYEERERILTQESIHPNVCRLITHVVDDAIARSIGEDSKREKWDLADLNNLILPIIPLEPITLERLECENVNELKVELKLEAYELYEKIIEKYALTENVDEIEKVVLLKCIDTNWTRHIDDIDQLKSGIHLESYSGKNPLDQFKIYAYNMFDEMVDDIREEAIYILYHAKFRHDLKREEVAQIVDSVNNLDEGQSIDDLFIKVAEEDTLDTSRPVKYFKKKNGKVVKSKRSSRARTLEKKKAMAKVDLSKVKFTRTEEEYDLLDDEGFKRGIIGNVNMIWTVQKKGR